MRALDRRIRRQFASARLSRHTAGLGLRPVVAGAVAGLISDAGTFLEAISALTGATFTSPSFARTSAVSPG